MLCGFDAVSGWASTTSGASNGDNDDDDEAWRWEPLPEVARAQAKCCATLAAHEDSPLEALVATGGGDEMVRLWRLRLSLDGSVAAEPACLPASGHTGGIHRLRVADPRGTRLVSCSTEDGTVRRGLPACTSQGAENPELSDDGFVSAQVRLWDLRKSGADEPPAMIGLLFGETTDQLHVVSGRRNPLPLQDRGFWERYLKCSRHRVLVTHRYVVLLRMQIGL